jgi:hypothetical protein
MPETRSESNKKKLVRTLVHFLRKEMPIYKNYINKIHIKNNCTSKGKKSFFISV